MSVSAPASTLPRLLTGMRTNGAMTLDHHLQIHGGLPPLARRRRDAALALLNELERSGLRGRGGGGFPVATKLMAVAAARGRAIVVANGCEGEPASVKDRLLLEHLPHLVIDGALIAAHAVDASEVMIAVDELATRAVRAMGKALRERIDVHEGAPNIRLVPVPSGYVSGQEAALASFLNGGTAKPTTATSPIFERGVRGRPTLVNNLETLAHVALIARHGADWFRGLGTDTDPGSTLVTLAGAVVYPGVFEIGIGSSIATLLEAAGGASGELRAFLLGGYSGTWVRADLGYQRALTRAGSDATGATLGAGVVFALPSSACPVNEIAGVARWLSDQSAGQCGPCVFGLDAIANALEQVRFGDGDKRALKRIHRWASLARGRGACAHPDGAVRFVTSAIDAFGTELGEHVRRGPCPACARPRLLPTSAAAQTRRAA
jgi:NADH:ubiquinone oxidoreductase subunit F (NADH-binding)